MKGFGVEVANLGNNHSQDYGAEAMLDGRLNLESVGIAAVGAGAGLAQANEPAIFELGGWKVAVLGFGGIRPNDGWIATSDRPGMADGDDIESMVNAVKAAAAQADWVIVTIHWGVELDTTPRSGDVAIGTALIEAGADAIFGHHPHRLQPLEMVDGRPVAWSLGNFVWPNMSPASSTTAVARVVISPDGKIDGCLIPAVIESSGHPVLTGEPPCGPST
jgi:poly-gamma-glutamate synthesis protein (capsule biosynthesis protein)